MISTVALSKLNPIRYDSCFIFKKFRFSNPLKHFFTVLKTKLDRPLNSLSIVNIETVPLSIMIRNTMSNLYNSHGNVSKLKDLL